MAVKHTTLSPSIHRPRQYARNWLWRLPESGLQACLSRGTPLRLSVRLATPCIAPNDLRCISRSHIDSARAYRNEAQVGDAVRESRVPREDIFISLRRTVFGRAS